MTVEYKSGEAKVIANGSVFTFGNSPIDIVLYDVGSKGSSFIFRFSFSQDEKDASVRAVPVQEDSSTLYHLNLINYNNALGTGHLTPCEFASSKNGLHLYMVFMVKTWENNLSRQVTYTIYSRNVQIENGGKNV